jgi:hypothetical protein
MVPTLEPALVEFLNNSSKRQNQCPVLTPAPMQLASLEHSGQIIRPDDANTRAETLSRKSFWPVFVLSRLNARVKKYFIIDRAVDHYGLIWSNIRCAKFGV